jgi:hypothetical protein
MRALNSREALNELKRVCGRNGIDLEIETAKGSHKGLRFREVATGKEVRIVIPGHKQLSPGVQRAILNYLKGLSRVGLVEVIRGILENVFGG